MANWTSYLIDGAFGAGGVMVVLRWLRKDVTGVANKVRELERKRIRHIAVEIEMAADNPDHVRRLAKLLHDDT